MKKGVDQSIHGNGNIQAAGDIIINTAEGDDTTPPAIDTYLRLAYYLLFISLIGTTLPHPTINTITSLGVIANFLIICFLTILMALSPFACSSALT